jgi:hypothetical protein
MRKTLVIFGACAVALAAAGCGRDTAASAGDTETSSTTTPPPPVAPLTGAPDPDGAARSRCAVTVKIDNLEISQPHDGVSQADVVYEEVVEYDITRLAAVFNSQAPERVGPVRSVRRTDQTLVWPIGGVFAFSGGAPYAIESIDTAPVVQLDESRAGDMMFRDNSRPDWYTLFADVAAMYGECGPKIPPPPLFSYRAPGAPPAGTPATKVNVGFLNGYDVTWTWNPTTGSWDRTIYDEPELDSSGAVLSPRNVVVMFSDYVGGDGDGVGAEASLTGTGRLIVLTGGHQIEGTWSRPDKEQPARLLDSAGAEILLEPGQTWVELPETSYSVTVEPSVDSPS